MKAHYARSWRPAPRPVALARPPSRAFWLLPGTQMRTAVPSLFPCEAEGHPWSQSAGFEQANCRALRQIGETASVGRPAVGTLEEPALTRPVNASPQKQDCLELPPKAPISGVDLSTREGRVPHLLQQGERTTPSGGPARGCARARSLGPSLTALQIGAVNAAQPGAGAECAAQEAVRVPLAFVAAAGCCSSILGGALITGR